MTQRVSLRNNVIEMKGMKVAAHLRISEVVIQAKVVWDDGNELSPGPELNAIRLPLSRLATVADELLAQLPDLEAQAGVTSDDEDDEPEAEAKPKPRKRSR